jgi:hypothetical protein
MPRESNNNNGGNSDENNSWKNALSLGVNEYAILINKNWNDFTIDVANTTIERVNRYLFHYILHYQKQSYTNYKLWEYFREDFKD